MSLLHWVWLGLALQPGSPLANSVIRRFPDPEEFFEAGLCGINELGNIPEDDKMRIRATTLDMAKRALEKAEDYGAKVITRDSEFFPKRLLTLEDCPVLLYVLGDEGCLNSMPAVAVVGTRRMTDYGKLMTDLIAGGIAAAGGTVISGMAEGVDTAAHKAALENGGKTVAVQGCGILNTYPEENIEFKEMIAANGAVISEFAPDAGSQSSYFPIRNRIVSGMSLGVCVIEGAYRSGTSITARLAREQGRDVFAVPGDVFRSTSHTTLKLLKEGAIPVSCAADILEKYETEYKKFIDLEKANLKPQKEMPAPEKPKAPEKKPLPKGVSKNAAALYEHIGAEPRSADELSVKAGFKAFETAAALTELEIYGLIKPAPGRRFIIA